jgi:hypothetical protein
MKAWGRPLVGTFGGGVIGERDVDVLVNVCDIAEEREERQRRAFGGGGGKGGLQARN